MGCLFIANCYIIHLLKPFTSFYASTDRENEDEKKCEGGEEQKKERCARAYRSYFSPSTSTSRFRVSRVPPSTRNIRACHQDEANVSPVHSIYFTCLFQSRLITFAATSCGYVYGRINACICVRFACTWRSGARAATSICITRRYLQIRLRTRVRLRYRV